MADAIVEYMDEGLYCYKQIAGKPEEIAESPLETSQQRLHAYLNWAETLLEKRIIYCLIRRSPDVANQPYAAGSQHAVWSYNVHSNDFDGMGIDKGFEEKSANKGTAVDSMVFQLASIQQLKELPEDAFGDFSSHVSFFGLQESREAAVKQFLAAGATPNLATFLQPKELFIHTTVGKEQGYYDAFLVKSGSDISAKIAQVGA